MSLRAWSGRAVKLLQTRNGRIIVSAALLAVLFTRLDVSKIADALVSIRWDYTVAALVTFGASLVLGNVQWVMLLALQGIHLPFKKTLSFYFVGAFFNNFLPANIGGDIVRVYDVYRESSMPNESIAATVTDRLFGMAALALLAVPAGMFVAARYARLGLERGFGIASLLMVLAFVAIFALACAVLFSRRLARILDRLVRPLFGGGIRDRFRKIYESFYVYRMRSSALPAVILVAIVVQTLRTVVHYEIAKAMGLPIPAIYFFLFVPVIAIFIALPVSIGGLGVREGLGIFFFCKAVPALGKEQALVMGLLAYLVGIVVSLAGGVIYLARGLASGRIAQNLSDGREVDADRQQP